VALIPFPDPLPKLRASASEKHNCQMEGPYLIRAATEADLSLLSRWRSNSHVARWWGDATLEPEREKLQDERVAMWIAEYEHRPFAFIKDYAVKDWLPHHFEYLPSGSRGMDVYVGEHDLLGQGHGSSVVRQHVDHLLSQGAPAVGIDPHPDNGAARRAFEKAGFKIAGGPIQTRWSRAILMDRFA
jgi:aminoglycoside 6'-N-acetyltransferase